MKKTIKTEELLAAIQKVKTQAREQYEAPQNEQEKNHGFGMDDAMTILEVLLKLDNNPA